jgi:hypothetical protein
VAAFLASFFAFLAAFLAFFAAFFAFLAAFFAFFFAFFSAFLVFLEEDFDDEEPLDLVFLTDPPFEPPFSFARMFT